MIRLDEICKTLLGIESYFIKKEGTNTTDILSRHETAREFTIKDKAELLNRA